MSDAFKSSFNIPESDSKRSLPEWLRSIAITGPTEGVNFDGWQEIAIERVEEFLREHEDASILITDSATCKQLLPSLKLLQGKFKGTKIKLVTMEHYKTLYHIVPFEYRDVLLELRGTQFPVLIEAMSQLEEFEYLPQIQKLRYEVDEVVEIEDPIWSANLGIGLETNKVFEYLEEKSSDLVRVEVFGTDSIEHGRWRMSDRRHGIYINVSSNCSGRQEIDVRFGY